MFRLIDRHFAGVRREAFEADLDEKQCVIQLLDSATGTIQGFSTQVVWELEVEGRPVSVVYSGDTIVDRRHWGSSILARLWGRFVANLLEERPESELVWFLISKGFRTYRFLPLYFREFYPRHDRPTPPWPKAIIDVAARVKFAGAYDAEAGIIRAGPNACRLRCGVAEVTAARLTDPHVRYFAGRNPGHVSGDELCCLAPLRWENFTGAGRRMMGLAPQAAAVV
jgi:hypothetical protein